ncbi:MAG: co-chaperone GroES [bacterium]|nr:co-chaperone GroES [bacterium]
MAKLKPLGYKVVVERTQAVEKTAGGIVIPDTAKEKPEQGKVVAVGKDVEEIKVGDVIVFGNFAATEIKVDGKEYLVVRQKEVLAIIS